MNIPRIGIGLIIGVGVGLLVVTWFDVKNPTAYNSTVAIFGAVGAAIFNQFFKGTGSGGDSGD